MLAKEAQAPSKWVAPSLTSGLGNRLFQFAAAAGAAEKWAEQGYQLVFTTKSCTTSPHGQVGTLFRMFPHIPLIEEGAQQEYKEPKREFYKYHPLPEGAAAAAAGAAKIVIEGFRQNPSYFPRSLAAITPDWDSALGGAAVRKWLEHDAGLSDPLERRRTVSLHVRLGDYKHLKHHQQDLAAYYAKGVALIKPGMRLHLFSDEPELCMRQFADLCAEKGVHFTYARVRADVESLYEMSLCLGGNITANSTFSWWGAWFAHQAGSPWATYPDKWGQGMPDPIGVVPEWGLTLSTEPKQN